MSRFGHVMPSYMNWVYLTKKRVPDEVYDTWDKTEQINTSDMDCASQSDGSDADGSDDDIVAAAASIASDRCGSKRRAVSLSDTNEETPDNRQFKKTKFGHITPAEDCMATFMAPSGNFASSDSEASSGSTARVLSRGPRPRVASQRRRATVGSFITPACPFVLFTVDEVRLWGHVQGQDSDGNLFVNPWSPEYMLKVPLNLPQ
ncbi:hypothetical protein HWV62_315 [Athelia sp. TMB]|nr:hypothetical protein HWV62_315 [Athelia sp. TMB]